MMPPVALSIAIVDDSDFIRSIARRVIDQLQFQILVEAVNGFDLFSQLKGLCVLPDICLLDLEMPVMDGFDTAIALRREYPVIRILAYSSNASPEYISRIHACGAREFLAKDSDFQKWKEALMRVAADLKER